MPVNTDSELFAPAEAIVKAARENSIYHFTVERLDAALKRVQSSANSKKKSNDAVESLGRMISELPLGPGDSARLAYMIDDLIVTRAGEIIHRSNELRLAGERLQRAITDPLQSFDARDWAESFRKTAIKLGYSDMDEGWLISWFANALMRGFDESSARHEAEKVKRGIESA